MEVSRCCQRRHRLLQTIASEARETASFTGRPVFAPEVMEAMRSVPRHCFVDPELEAAAWDNRPLAIGHGQTISQPFIVALMTDVLAPEPHHRILEVGTGSGYQAAVLAQLAGHVHSLEIIPSLAEAAQARLHRLGHDNVTVHCADGYHGWPEAAPFDGIIITAATPTIPPPLIDQMARGGRLIAPLGSPWDSQMLVVVTRDEQGALTHRNLLPVAFVPLRGEGERASE